jgi:antitoxin component YwqK of YwqJK toxin-antitoxin module
MNPNDPKITIPPPTKPLRHVIMYYYNTDFKFSEYNLNENDHWHDLYERWYQNGQLWVRSNYKNGLRHGLYEVWHDNGQLWIRCNYQNDLHHGLYKEWHLDGSLYSRRFYNNGKIEK